MTEKKMTKRLSKYNTALGYAEKTLPIFSGAPSDVSFCSLTTAIGTPVRIASTSISFAFLTSNRIAKIFLKTMGR